jgi:S1-C subfamily serine protease
MSTTPNPTPTILGQEMYAALVAGFAPQNAAIIASAKAGQAITITVPSLAAIQVVEAISQAGLIPTSAQIAAQIQPYTFTPNPAAPAAPPYSLGTQIGPGAYFLKASGAYPPAGVPIQIGTSMFDPEWFNMFDMTVTYLGPAAS